MHRLLRTTVLVFLVLVFVKLGSGVPVFGGVNSLDSATGRVRPASVGLGTKAETRPSVPAEPPVAFETTAYCQAGITRSGVDTHTGIAAADPAELPVGSVVQVDTRAAKYSGVYTILDTGGKVRGRILDLFLHDCNEAQQFGRQTAHVKVLRRGWNPRSTRQRVSLP